MTNYIDEYYQKIKSGEIEVGKWTILAYEHIIHGLEHGEFFYDAKKAELAIKCAERFTHHHEGVLAPQRLKLELWQKALLSCIFGIVDEQKNRQFREVLCIMGRKQGKTLIASAVAEIMTYFDGEYGARTYFCAPKLEQAALCYDAFQQSIAHEPALSEITRKRRTDIYISETNSVAKPLAFNAKKSDGLNVSCAICDEVAAWQGDAGLKFYEVIKSSVGARKQPLILSITTAGYQNEGIYDEMYKRATRFLMGDSREQRLFPIIYQIDNVQQWNDINELKKANPNLGVSVSRDYLFEEIAVAEQSLSKKAEFLTKYCNIKQNSSIAWLPSDKIEACTGPKLNLEDFKECYCVCGIDLSQTTDLTACTAIIERDGILNIFAQFYMPSEKVDELTARDGLPYRQYVERGLLKLSGENYVDYHDCFNWMRSLINDYHIYPLQTGYDRYCAQYLVQDLENYGFHTDDVYQGYNLSPVIREAEGYIKDGKVNIGDNDLLKVHFLNSALQFDTGSGKCRLIKIAPTDHIDGMAATLDALTVRQKYYDQMGQMLKNER